MRRERCVKIGRKSSGVIFSEGAASKNTRRIGALARRIVEMTEHTRTVLHCIESFFSSRRMKRGTIVLETLIILPSSTILFLSVSLFLQTPLFTARVVSRSFSIHRSAHERSLIDRLSMNQKQISRYNATNPVIFLAQVYLFIYFLKYPLS